MQHGIGSLGRSNIPANAFVPVRPPKLPPHLRPTNEPVDELDAATAPERDATANGALRNLDAGHYKGVPAARLTLNFLDELRAREALAAGDEQTRGAGLDTAVDELRQAVADLPETSELTASTAIQFEAASSAFLDVVAQLRDDSLDQAEFAQRAQLAIEDFALELEALGADDAAATGAFTALVSELESVLEDVLGPPTLAPAPDPIDLPAPAGRGAAYAKFLAAYEQVTGGSDPTDDAPLAEGSSFDARAWPDEPAAGGVAPLRRPPPAAGPRVPPRRSPPVVFVLALRAGAAPRSRWGCGGFAGFAPHQKGAPAA